MTKTVNFIAADLGASGGRVMVGKWDGSCFSLQELHRFPNGGVMAESGLYWDVLGIWEHLQEGMRKYRSSFNDSPEGIGVDAWGVDFGLLDGRGRLIGNPVHYRDLRTRGMAKLLFELVPESEIFAATGTQTLEFNTLFQLYSMVLRKDPQLEWAETLLTIPDLFGYLLTGEKNVEYTQATTTQMYSPAEGGWATGILAKVGIPAVLLPQVISPGTMISPVRSEVLRHCGFDRPIPTIAVASHDTASAVASIPNMDASSVFICCGTWSLIGVQVAEPNISDAAMRLHFTNEGAADGSVLLLKNITGLWILQQCLEHWKLQGRHYQWSDIVQEASSAKPFRSLFDPDDGRLQVQADMPGAIQRYCRVTGQELPRTVGEIARCALESLSLKYRSAMEALELLTARELRTLRIVGGGSLNRFLCQMTADACNRPVVAGPAEASALGNVILQGIATGHLPDLRAAQEPLAASVDSILFEPQPSDAWSESHARFRRLEAA